MNSLPMQQPPTSPKDLWEKALMPFRCNIQVVTEAVPVATHKHRKDGGSDNCNRREAKDIARSIGIMLVRQSIPQEHQQEPCQPPWPLPTVGAPAPRNSSRRPSFGPHSGAQLGEHVGPACENFS